MNMIEFWSDTAIWYINKGYIHLAWASAAGAVSAARKAGLYFE